MQSLAVLMPVYNDWVSLEEMLRRIDVVAAEVEEPLSVLIVNDGSISEPPAISLNDFSCIRHVRYVHLVTNQGHQRAIAVGLVVLAQEDHDAVIVMDSDGEDRPEDIPFLLEEHQRHPDCVIVAQRAARSEGSIFRAFYLLYKFLFWLLTGASIRFGNFCLIPRPFLITIVYRPDLWNHLAATIRRSNIPLIEVPTPRGKRIAGRSTMNFTALVLHGLSGISVYLDLVAIRILLFSVITAVLAGLGIVVAVLVRYLTPLAIPGWATTVVGLLTIIILQAILFSVAVLFTMLNARSRQQIIPAVNAPQFIRSIEVAATQLANTLNPTEPGM